MKKYVVDTSVIIKWLAPQNEKHLDKALKLLDDLRNERIEIITSDFVYYEVGNVLRWGKRLAFKDYIKAFRALFSTPLTFLPFDKNMVEIIFSIMQHKLISFYDSLFVAIAHLEGCPLISADEKHHRGLPNVVFLKDYK